MDDQNRLDEQVADYTDMILSGRDAASSDEITSEARTIQALNRVIAPDQSMDSAMRARMNQRINEEWDQVQQHKKARRIISFPTSAYGRVAVAAALAVVVGVIAIIVSTGDSEGTDVSATAQGDSSALVIVIAVAAVVVVVGFLYFLMNRRQ